MPVRRARSVIAIVMATLMVTSPAASAASAAERMDSTPATYELDVRLLDRDGVPVEAGGLSKIVIRNLDDSDFLYYDDPGRIRLPAGRYAVHGVIRSPRAGHEPSYSFISHPELPLGGDTELTLDARIGKRLHVAPADPAARGGTHGITVLTRFHDCDCTQGLFEQVDPRFHEFYGATVPGTQSDTYAIEQQRRATEPELELWVRGRSGFEVFAHGFPNTPTPVIGGTTRAVYGGRGTAEDLARIDASGKLVVVELPPGTTYGDAVDRIAAIKAAGARLAMIVIGPGAVMPAARHGEPTPALPTLTANTVSGRRFVDIVKGGGVPVSYSVNPRPAHRYELAYGAYRRLTTDQVHVVQRAELAAVRTTYYENAGRSVRNLGAANEFFGERVGFVHSLPVDAPQVRTEYFTPGSWTLSGINSHSSSDYLTSTMDLRAGKTYDLGWNKAVTGPAFRGPATGTRERRPWAWRHNGALDVILPMYGDSAGRPRVPVAGIDSGSIRLFLNGEPVGNVAAPDAASFPVPEEEASYRLFAETRRTARWWPLSTRVVAAWTFRSSAEREGAVLPLLTVRFDPALDLRNRAPASREFAFPAFVERADTIRPQAAELAVAVSYDDGLTWRPASTRRAGDHWVVTVRHPRRGYASLRATAVDTTGNTVEQTVIRAYQVGR